MNNPESLRVIVGELKKLLSEYKKSAKFSEIYKHPEIKSRCVHIFVDGCSFVEINLEALASLEQTQRANWQYFLKKRVKEAIHER